MVKLFRALVFRHRLKKQIRLADERKRRTGKKQFVINLGCLKYRLPPAVRVEGAHPAAGSRKVLSAWRDGRRHCGRSDL